MLIYRRLFIVDIFCHSFLLSSIRLEAEPYQLCPGEARIEFLSLLAFQTVEE